MKAYFINDENMSIRPMNVPDQYVDTITRYCIAEVGIIIPGQRVKTKTGKEGVILDRGLLPGFIDIEFDTGEIDTFNYTDLDYVLPPLPKEAQKTCTCGAEKCGFTSHSDWCDINKKE